MPGAIDDAPTNELENLRLSMAEIERRVLNSERTLGFITDASDDIIIEVQPRTGEMKLDSAKLFRLYGIPTSCQTLNDLMANLYGRLHHDDKRRFLSDFQVMSDGSFPLNMRTKTTQYRFLEHDDRYCRLQISASLYFDDSDNDLLFLCIRNTTGIYPADSHDFLSEQDSLTGAYNMEALGDRVKMHLSYRKSEGILVIYRLSNINLVKENASFGIGNEAISEFMRLIRRGIRQDDYIARTDPEEYTVFITGNRSKKAMERGIFEVKKRFSEYLEERQLPTGISVSAGIAFAFENDADFEALRAAAEKSMSTV